MPTSTLVLAVICVYLLFKKPAYKQDKQHTIAQQYASYMHSVMDKNQGNIQQIAYDSAMHIAETYKHLQSPTIFLTNKSDRNKIFVVGLISRTQYEKISSNDD